MLTESVMRRLRRGDPVAQFFGDHRRALWVPLRARYPGTNMLFGPARGTYWLEDGELHVLYEPRDQPARHFAGPVPPKRMAPALVYLLLMWPLVAAAAALAGLLATRAAEGLSAVGLVAVAVPILALVLLLTGRLIRWRHASRMEPAAVVTSSSDPGREIGPDVLVPDAVRVAVAEPLPMPRAWQPLARRVTRIGLAVACSSLAVATFVLDPLSREDGDPWSIAAVIVGACGLLLLFLSVLILIGRAAIRWVHRMSLS